MKRFTQTLSVFATLGWFVLASASTHAQSRVQAAIENPSSEINDAFILLKVDAPENEVKYFWSNSFLQST